MNNSASVTAKIKHGIYILIISKSLFMCTAPLPCIVHWNVIEMLLLNKLKKFCNQPINHHATLFSVVIAGTASQ